MFSPVTDQKISPYHFHPGPTSWYKLALFSKHLDLFKQHWVMKLNPLKLLSLAMKQTHSMIKSDCYSDIMRFLTNRPVSYSNGWTGFSMKWRLMRAN